MNFIDEIAFAEREKIFKTLKEYVEMNKIDFLEFDTRKIYIGTEELLKVIEELFFAIRLNTKVKEAKWIFYILITIICFNAKECCYTKYLMPLKQKKFLLRNIIIL